MGDLFDKTVISNECLNRVINIFEKAANSNKDTKYFILNGNHDMTKDKNKISSFDLFIKYFNKNPISNLKIIYEFTQVYMLHNELVLYFSHYNPYMSLDDELKDKSYGLNIDGVLDKAKLRIAFGHWEVTDFSAISGNEKFIDRLIPKYIINNFDVIFTGHEHKPKKLNVHEKPVCITGSMLPYAFGEQLSNESDQYLVIDNTSLITALSKDKNVFINTNVRVLYKSGDELPYSFPCLSRTSKLVDEPVVNTPNDNSESEVATDEPLSFSKSFYSILEQYKTKYQGEEYLTLIENSFLNKNYNKD